MSTKLRYYEYYNMQINFDWLYKRSNERNTKGIDLYKIITSDDNIMLAYRTIKRNKGSKTVGVDGMTISDYKIKDKNKFIDEIKQTLENYQPNAVRRVYILKPNGKKRPLGIPTMRDRLIQQMFKQILEPICEARFYKHSYGFRPNRSCKHALARCNYIMYKTKCHYVVDIDIKSFFDNVNHTKLLKQLYSIGICDKRILALVYKMLKSKIAGEGIPRKGVPQGGVISTLLSNVVLNALDWWISNQWETFRTKKDYKSNRYRTQKQTNLKQMYIVRYCDDFKIFTNNWEKANKIYHAVKGYLANQLKLEISEEKSKITNLRRQFSQFLGFEIKVEKQRRNKYVSISRVSGKAIDKIKKEIKRKVKKIEICPTVENAHQYNLYVQGIHNYYRYATRVSLDFSDIAYSCLLAMYNRLTKVGVYGVPRSPPFYYTKMYKSKRRTFKIDGIYLFPVSFVKWQRADCFNPKINNYTLNGRMEKIKQLDGNIYNELQKLHYMHTECKDVEYMDNRISRYSMQMGKCAVTGKFVEAEMVHCHHVIPKCLGGTNKFVNLVIVNDWVHKLIHATNEDIIRKYMQLLKLNKKQLMKLNKFRKECNLALIT